MLERTDLTKTDPTTIPPTRILHGIDVTVAEGEFLVSIGVSGAGKPTLLYVMSVIDRPRLGP